MSFATRFAPSPTGPLHLGHAYSAMLAHDRARAESGRFVLRIEDIDRARARPHWEARIKEDLTWLGLQWDGPVMRQSDRLAAYDAALDALWARGLLYPCSCTRRDIAAAASAPQEDGDPLVGPDGVVYPGTCRGAARRGARPAGAALRLDMRKALEHIAADMDFVEETEGVRVPVRPDWLIAAVGDVVLSRRDFTGSYHLSVVLDDAAQGITHVIRGADLREATPIHVLLQHLLGLPVPVYHHHRLIRDAGGRRLAKRDDARAIATFRDAGHTPGDIRAIVGLQPATGCINSVSAPSATEM